MGRRKDKRTVRQTGEWAGRQMERQTDEKTEAVSQASI